MHTFTIFHGKITIYKFDTNINNRSGKQYFKYTDYEVKITKKLTNFAEDESIKRKAFEFVIYKTLSAARKFNSKVKQLSIETLTSSF